MRTTEYSWGRSKIFIRNPRSLFDLEDRRRAQTIVLAVKIQSLFRGWKQKTLYKKMRKAQITISSNFRGFKAKRDFQKMKNAQILIASYLRMIKHRRVSDSDC